MTAYRIIVSGRVQGVGFRWFVQREAEHRGVSGFVRNLPDGRVEVFAQGEPDLIEDFAEAIRRGPRGARVEDITKEAVPADGALRTFQIRF